MLGMVPIAVADRGRGVFRMLETNLLCIYGKISLQRTALSESRREAKERNELGAGERPLTCMVYFFASQMKKHVEDNRADQRLALEKQGQATPIHRLDSLQSKVKIHASYFPLITRFETILVETPQAERTGGNRQLCREISCMMLCFSCNSEVKEHERNG
jgi:hypothetical protein